ncbi:metallopeptidase [Candidatus Shapirobacteria bacterium CG09_land_8_20_14_0_10_38_17]|uniref:Metallopeptidase n=1 Tax=Candidatus Shapirobacteria bacterium CG09_land_8_20_14_0_10_38_17 TaxID=1974884 RepID=A0A2H0WR08_9BACT|nr:MAG: metallopeptidase [Candidatus Shapirobacteria bacterium CG09_land_8_20_14_0_10_38_17]
MEFKKADDIKQSVVKIIRKLKLSYVKKENIFCYRSLNSHSRAIARIWSLPRLWQDALGILPYYIIEVLSEKFDHLSEEQKTKVLIHELLHIPKTFSGALLPHRTGTFRLDQKIVDKMYQEYERNIRNV